MVSWNLLCVLLVLSGIQVNGQLLTHFLAPLAGYMRQIPPFTFPTPTTLGSDTTTVTVTESGVNRVDNDVDETAPTKPAFVVDNGADSNLLERLAGPGQSSVAPRATDATVPIPTDTDAKTRSADWEQKWMNKLSKATTSPIADPAGGQQQAGIGEQSPFRVSGTVPQRQFVPDQRQLIIPPHQRWQQQQQQQQPPPGQQRQSVPQQQQQWFQPPPNQQPQFVQPGPFGQQRQQQNQPFDQRREFGLAPDPRAIHQNRSPVPHNQNPGQPIPGQQLVDRPPQVDNRFQTGGQNVINNRFQPARNDQRGPASDNSGPWAPPPPKFNNPSPVTSDSLASPNDTSSPTPDLVSSTQIPTPSPIQDGTSVVPQAAEPKIDKTGAGTGPGPRDFLKNVRRLQFTDDARLQPQAPQPNQEPSTAPVAQIGTPSHNQQLLQRFGLTDAGAAAQ